MRQCPLHLAVCLVCLLGAAPTTRLSQQRMIDAIKTLRIEFEKSKDGAELRSQSNFFSTGDGLSEAVVIEALRDSVSRDPACESYVKWQLLSGVDSFRRETAASVAHIYRAAPLPLGRPGLTESDRQELDELAAGAAKKDIYPLTRQFEETVSRNLRHNRHILAYRDELYRKLPKTHATMLAALEDLYERFRAGLAIKTELDAWINDVRQWITSSNEPATPAQLIALAETVEQILLDPGPAFYTEASWDGQRVVWKKSRPSLRRSPKLKNLATELRRQAEKPKSELKFRDE